MMNDARRDVPHPGAPRMPSVLCALALLVAVGGAPLAHEAPARPVASRLPGAPAAPAVAAVPAGGEQEAASGEEGRREERLQELQATFDEARSVFQTDQQYDSIALFTEVIDALDELAAAAELGPEARDLLIRSLSYRAEVRYNFGELERAVEDMRRILSLEPGYEEQRSVSPKLIEEYDALRREMVGRLDLDVRPAEAEVRLDGDRLEPDAAEGLLPVLAGQHTVTASLPGYEESSASVSVEGGSTKAVELELERVGAVVKLLTWPTGVTVSVDGEVVGTTRGAPPEDWTPGPDTADHPRSEFSDELVVEVSTGEHVFELGKDGFRSTEIEVPVRELADYSLGAVALSPARGTVVFRDLPEAARVELDDEAVEPVPPGSVEEGTAGASADAPLLRLAPGTYRIRVSHDAEGIYQREVTLEDRDVVELDVRLRPAVSLLGVLGGDEAASEGVREAVSAALSSTDRWMQIDPAVDVRELLSSAGGDAEALRQAAIRGRRGEAFDWSRLQAASDERVSASLYLLAVLSDDLLARDAYLWAFPAAPGPAAPDLLRLSLDDEDPSARLAQRLSVTSVEPRAWLGALLVDSPVAAGPTVASVQEDGPAASGGLQVGDVIAAAQGTETDRVRDVMQRIRTAGPGGALSLRVQGDAGSRTLEIELGSSPSVIPIEGGEAFYSAVWVDVRSRRDREDPRIPRWVLELNLAVVELRATAWADAVRRLRRLDAPEGPGLGKGTVDYWLGLALSAAGVEYLDSARSALQRAAEAEGARLHHRDGPLVAPRARARISLIGR